MTQRPITPADLWALRRVGQPTPAPDGSFVIVPVSDYDEDHPKGITSLYRLTPDAAPHQITTPGIDSSQPAVSPDATRLAFIRTPAGEDDGQPYVMPLDGGESRRIAEFPLGAADPRWAPDGTAVYVLAPVLIADPSLEGTTRLAAERRDAPLQVHVTEDRLYRYWDHWLTDGKVHHIFRCDLETGAVIDLTPEATGHWWLDGPAGHWDIAPDGAEIAYAVDISEPPHDRLQWAVFTVPTAGGTQPSQLVDDLPAYQFRPRYSPDGRHLVYGIQREWDFYADRVRLVRYDRETGAETVLTENWDRSAGGWEFIDAATIVLGAEDNATTNLYTMPLDVTSEPDLLVQGGAAHGARPARDGNVYFRIESMRAPAEVARVDATGGEVQRISGFNDDLMAQLEMGEVESITFSGADGDAVQAYLVYPPGFDPVRQWPLVHDIHGGPHGISGDEWHYRWNPQVFAAPGYVVVLVNFHGSTSWGQDFAACIHGAWGDKPTTDILAATDHLIDEGWVDPERMAIAGGSYGGYMVSWLTGQTDRFATAICHAGVTNLIGQYASDITQGRPRAMGANAWEDVSAVQRWSPTNHTDDIVTPTLVIHGEQDYRVVVTQGLELYGILKAKGVEARLVYYPDENHWILQRHNSLHWYGEFLGWLERYLGPPVAEAESHDQEKSARR